MPKRPSNIDGEPTNPLTNKDRTRKIFKEKLRKTLAEKSKSKVSKAEKKKEPEKKPKAAEKETETDAADRKEWSTIKTRRDFKEALRLKLKEKSKPPIREVKEDEVIKPAVKAEKPKDSKKIYALKKAIKKGKFDKAKRLVEKGLDVNQIDEFGDGDTPLITAIQKGDKQFTKYLLDHGADPNQADHHKDFPLETAIQCHKKDLIPLLVEYGADVNQDDGSPLNAAINIRDIEIIEFLIDKGVDVNGSTESRRIPLLKAVQMGDIEIIEFLIDKGADVNRYAKNRWSPLNESVSRIIRMRITKHKIPSNQDINIVKLLIDKGADLTFKDENGETVLDMARRFVEHENIAPALTQLIQLFEEIETRNKMESVLDKDQEPLDPEAFARLKKGRPPIREVPSDMPPQKQESAADLLNLNEKLLEAIKNENDEAVGVLIDNGADINHVVADGNTTPSILSVSLGRIKALGLLFEKGVDVNQLDKEGRTLLIWAIYYYQGDNKTLEFLVKKGIDINKPDNAGNTPLIWAVSEEKVGAVQFLVDNGADLYAKNESGQTALDFARHKGKEDILDILEAKDKELQEAKRKGEAGKLNELGNKAKEKGDLESAEKYYQQALAINPNDLNALNTLGIIYGEKGSLDMAKQYFIKAIEIDPNYEPAHFNLGLIFEKQDDHESAGKHYKRVLEINPKNVAANNNLGHVLEEGGNMESAKYYYQKALEIDPNNEIARQNLEKITKELERRKKDEEKFQAPGSGQIQNLFNGDAGFSKQPSKPPASTKAPEPIKESADKRPTTGQLNSIGLDLSQESPSAVRGQDRGGTKEEQKIKRVRGTERLKALCRIILEKDSSSPIWQEAAAGYRGLVSQKPNLYIEDVDHRAIAIKFRNAYKAGDLQDYILAIIAHTQDVNLNPGDFEARAEAGLTYFGANDLHIAQKLFAEALSINPSPPTKYAWIHERLKEISERLSPAPPAEPETEEPVKIEPLPEDQVPVKQPGQPVIDPEAFSQLFDNKPPDKPVDESIPPPIPPFDDKWRERESRPKPEQKPQISTPPTLPNPEKEGMAAKIKLDMLFEFFENLAGAETITPEQIQRLPKAVEEYHRLMVMYRGMDFDHQSTLNKLVILRNRKVISPDKLNELIEEIKGEQSDSHKSKTKSYKSIPPEAGDEPDEPVTMIKGRASKKTKKSKQKDSEFQGSTLQIPSGAIPVLQDESVRKKQDLEEVKSRLMEINKEIASLNLKTKEEQQKFGQLVKEYVDLVQKHTDLDFYHKTMIDKLEELSKKELINSDYAGRIISMLESQNWG